MLSRRPAGTILLLGVFLSFLFVMTSFTRAMAGFPHSACYTAESDRIFWFMHITDIHIGTRGDQDRANLEWVVGVTPATGMAEGKAIIDPEFIVASGDLTDSTNGNLFGYPNGPYQAEWDEYRDILLRGSNINADTYYDIPGNHDAYSDQYFAYYLANSIQGQATSQTQISWTRTFAFGKYYFLGINTADNTGDSFSLSWPWGDYAGLDAGELAFINTELGNTQNDTDLTIIFGHHPITDTGYSDDTWLYYGAQTFTTYLDSYGASLYGYGHTHRTAREIFTGDDYTGQMTGDGVVYFNTASLGKSTENQYAIVAIDCNGLSSVTADIGSWPVVLITAPVDKYTGPDANPYAYTVPYSSMNPIRALVFDKNPPTSVKYTIDGQGEGLPMDAVAENPHLWQTVWDATSFTEGEHTIEVEAVSASGVSSHAITIQLGYDTTCNNNGLCESGEDCGNCPADCISGGGGDTGICGNAVCEPDTGEDCLTCPADCNGKQAGAVKRQFCCGDGDGTNPVGCTDSRCTEEGWRCGDAIVQPYYCCGDGSCDGAENHLNCAVDGCTEPYCGDGNCDPDENQCSCETDCGAPPVTELNCTDGIDNDCDGSTDSDDSDCTSICKLRKEPCTDNADCCSNKCFRGVCK